MTASDGGTPDAGERQVDRGSGDRAVAAAAERAKQTAARNIPVFDDLPFTDTANLREGANLHDALLALLPLVGVWRGEGVGHGTQGDYRFGQQIVVSHDGGDYLNWEARSWRLSDDESSQPALRETGF
ncbi:FABP family protein, partial [[Mycobacterium] nativiensis]